MVLLKTPFLTDLEKVLKHKEGSKGLIPRTGEFNQKHYLKCEYCMWSASYVDASGYLDINTKKVRCPTCKKGIVEIISTSYNQNEAYVPPSYLDFVLADW